MGRQLRTRLFSVLAGVMLFSIGVPLASADQRDFTLINGSSSTITQVYVEKSELNTWGEDVLGTGVLPAGDSVDIHFSGYDADECMFDIKVIASGGQEGFLYGIDLCSTSTVTVS
jgi:hypothetical protein